MISCQVGGKKRHPSFTHGSSTNWSRTSSDPSSDDISNGELQQCYFLSPRFPTNDLGQILFILLASYSWISVLSQKRITLL